MSDLAPESKSADDAVVRPIWSILAKGMTGTGKTIASCGKEFRPVYVFDFEGRFDSVISYYKKLDGNVKDVYYNHYPLGDRGSFSKMDAKMDAIAARPEYKTVVASSLTSFIRLVLVHLIRSVPDRDQDGKKSRGIKTKGGIRVNILEDFNYEDSAIINQLIGFFQELKDQGTNTILEAHITPYDIKSIDEDSGQKESTTIYEILTKGKKAPAEIPSWFNEVWLFEKKITGWDATNAQQQYIINTAGNSTNSCKTSFGIPSFDWTGLDPTIHLAKQLDPSIRDAPRIDPDAAKKVSW
jgi:hypothetical protein